MSEALKIPPSELWFDGPNYTADAVVVDQEERKLLLIRRRDTGDWALAGGFVDAVDPTVEAAARREAREEAGVVLASMGRLIYHGVVDDPRNTDRAWIETSAFLFQGDSNHDVTGSDDADQAAWHAMDSLPALYASHESIVRRAIDTITSNEQSMNIHDTSHTITPIDGGHMQYDKYLVESDDERMFVKAHSPDAYSDPAKAERSLAYLKKEAAAMAHLRTQGFSSLPAYSVMTDAKLAMEAFHADDGWVWRVPDGQLVAYVDSAIETFRALEATEPPADTFDIEATIESMRREGWHGFTDETYELLARRFDEFTPRLRADTRGSAERLLARLPELQKEAVRPRPSKKLVPAHHDARQSNIAWHPEHGTRLVDWSWNGYGEPGSDITNLLIDLHKSGHDISQYDKYINHDHCLRLIGFLLGHVTWPVHGDDDTVRFQQFISAVSAFEVLEGEYREPRP